MCLILFAHQLRPELPLVLLANRDEFLARPTAPLAPWDEVPGLLAGRDLVAGGTWFGLGRQGRWAAVTNIREGERTPPGGISRGWLVRDYLCGTEAPREYARKLASQARPGAGYNLLLGTVGELWYYSNRDRAPLALPPGLYGLSNGRLDTPWPKVVHGKAALATLLAKGPPAPEQGFRLLADRTTYPDHELPVTGVPLVWERTLSATFIVAPAYGTRSSTVLLHGAGAQWSLTERTFDGSPFCWTQRSYRGAGDFGVVA